MTGDEERDEALSELARLLARAGDEAAGLATSAVKRALLDDAPVDTTMGAPAAVRGQVLDAADAGFHRHMGEAMAEDDFDRLRNDWRRHLRRAALDAFDAPAPLPLDPEKGLRIIAARHGLLTAFGAKSKAKFLTQLLPVAK